MWPKLLFNYPSHICGLGYHGVCIRASTFPQMAKELLLHTYFKISTFISWSLYIPSHILIPPPYKSASFRYPCFPYPQIPFVPVAPLRRNGGLPSLEILGAYPAGKIDMRGSSLWPLFPPFRRSVSMSPWWSHFLPAALWPVSPDTTSSFAGTARADGSGGVGLSAWTTLEVQWPAGYVGSGIGQFQCWGPLTLWDIGPGSVSGPTKSPVSAPRWRAGGMRRWLGSIFCWWWPHRSPRLDRGSALTLRSRPGFGTKRPGIHPPARRQPPSCSSTSTQHRIPYCCKNKPGWLSWYLDSLGLSRWYVPPRWPTCVQIPDHRGCWGSQGIVPGGAASIGAVAPCGGGPYHDW